MRTIILAALLGVGLTGCVSKGVGSSAATYTYITGNLTSVQDHSLDEVYAATEKAMDRLGFSGVTKAKDALQGRIEASMADQTRVKVSMDKKGAKETELKISVGTLGDERRSQQIFEEIRKGL